jgi:hypothetical protein
MDWIDLHPTGYGGDESTAKGARLGRLVIGPVTVLRHAQEAVAPSLDVSVFAWVTDVELAVPTPFPVLAVGPQGYKGKIKKRGKDEYEEDGPVSSIATAVAGAAGHLTQVPFIGPFARATEIGASVVSSIAKIFGFSKPSMIDDTLRYKPAAFSNLAAFAGADTSEKLALDPKNEVFVGPGHLGLDSDDQMAFKFITSKESYVSTVTIDATSPAGTVIYTFPITPGLTKGDHFRSRELLYEEHAVVPFVPCFCILDWNY